MLIELERKRLMQAGYGLVKEWTGAKRMWPDDPSEKKNHLVIVPSDQRYAEEMLITSTRAITIARELPGGPMGERYGVVCGENDDGEGRSQFVLGGGKVQPDFDGTSADRLAHGEDRELVWGGVVAEVREELGVVFAEKDTDAYRSYLIFGVRGITERGADGTSLKKADGLSIGDACFIAITHERLGYFPGQKGETGQRHVFPASELLRERSREEREKNPLPMLPFAQATALALAIDGAKEIFGKDVPPALQEIVADGEREASRILRNNNYAKYFTRAIQEGPWEV